MICDLLLKRNDFEDNIHRHVRVEEIINFEGKNKEEEFEEIK